MQRNARRYLLLLVALAALAFFLYRFRTSISIQGFHWSMVGESLRQARIGLLLLALVTIYVCFAIRVLRWIRFSRTIYGRAVGTTHQRVPNATGRPRFWSVYSATLMGFSCTFLLGRAGEPIRPVLIGKKESLPIPAMFGVYVLERISDMAATAMLAGTALLFFERHGMPGGENRFVAEARSAGVVLLVLLLLAISFLVYFRYRGAAWLARRLQNPKWRTGWREKIAVLLEGFSDGLQGIRTWGDLGVLVWYSALHWTAVTMVYVWVAHAFGGALAQLTFAGALLVLAFTMVGSAVQLPGVGGGAQLATFLVLTLIFGVENEPAATVSIVVWLISFAGCCLVGLPLLFREGWSMGELRRMAQAEEQAGEAALLEEAELGGRESGQQGEPPS
jgi:glycosyltransferase 2 family protein